MSDREKRLIDANELKDSFGFLRKMWSATEICGIIDAMPTADVTEQKWISASEPPKVSGIYQVYTYDKELERKKVWYGQFVKPCSWFVYDIYGDGLEREVLYWMPLPEPPSYEDGGCRYAGECVHQIQTNADCIRSMNDDVLEIAISQMIIKEMESVMYAEGKVPTATGLAFLCYGVKARVGMWLRQECE